MRLVDPLYWPKVDFFHTSRDGFCKTRPEQIGVRRYTCCSSTRPKANFAYLTEELQIHYRAGEHRRVLDNSVRQSTGHYGYGGMPHLHAATSGAHSPPKRPVLFICLFDPIRRQKKRQVAAAQKHRFLHHSILTGLTPRQREWGRNHMLRYGQNTVSRVGKRRESMSFEVQRILSQ